MSCLDTKPPTPPRCPNHQEQPDEIMIMYTRGELLAFAIHMVKVYGIPKPMIMPEDLDTWLMNNPDVGIEINKSDLERAIQLLITLENAK